MSSSTSTSFVPLTTIFTPPLSCAPTGFLLLGTTSTGLAFFFPNQAQAYDIIQPECFPQGYSITNFFSPAPSLCPSGWELVYSSASVLPLSNHPTETGGICCQSGYNDANFFPLFAGYPCILSIASGATYAGYYGIATSGYETTSLSYTSLTLGNEVIGQAFGIMLRWQSTDLITSTTPTSLSLSTATSTFSTQTSLINNTKPIFSYQLSSGTKIGIGVAIPVFVLLFISLSFLFIRRKRQLKTKDESQEYRKPELEANSSTRAELLDSQGKEIVLITNSPGSNEIRELDSTPISAGQIQRRKPVASQVAVLPSDFRAADAVEGTVELEASSFTRAELPDSQGNSPVG